jgi:hypothetical protein
VTVAGLRYESLFRQLTPLVLIAVAVVALGHRSLPGETFVLGACVFALAIYVLLLWGEAMRMRAITLGVLKELVEFRKTRAAEAQGRPLQQKLEAARLLLPALASGDAQVRQLSRRNLALLAGTDLGDDVAAWQRWIAAQEPTAGSGGA